MQNPDSESIDPTRPLAGLTVVEVSSFVAAPSAGMTLGQLGADVIRVDPVGGGADYDRWPVTDAGDSIYWAGLNKGKRSVAADLRSDEGRDLVRRLVTESGPGGGILVTNTSMPWLAHDALAALRPDVVTVQILGGRNGTPGVDYTVNAAIGFPLTTGPADSAVPVNHLLPAWDVTCGLYAALAVTAAVRTRESTGRGTRVTIPLENVALAVTGNLGYYTEAQLGAPGRTRVGNAIFGTYGKDFATSDGRVMVVALTPRHIRDLAATTGTTDALAALESALGVDFSREGDRFEHREVLDGLFARWFRGRTTDDAMTALSGTSVLAERYRTFAETAAGPAVLDNPLFSLLDQPRIGPHHAPGLPLALDGEYPPPRPAPANGDDTAAVLGEVLGLDAATIDDLVTRGVLGSAAPRNRSDV